MADEKLRLTPHEEIEVVAADADRLEVLATYSAGGARPPMHRHPKQDERFEVLAGTVTVDLGGAVREYGEGEEFDVPRGVAHRMSNEGSVPARVRWTTSPAGRTLEWFRVLDATERRVGGRKFARVLALLPLLFKFRDTFRLARG
jgi:quercetin dioxygenase-like cupin family protein